jgi:hypothetical protein
VIARRRRKSRLDHLRFIGTKRIDGRGSLIPRYGQRPPRSDRWWIRGGYGRDGTDDPLSVLRLRRNPILFFMLFCLPTKSFDVILKSLNFTHRRLGLLNVGSTVSCWDDVILKPLNFVC